MPYREHGMWEILEVLRRVHAGEGRRSITRATGRSRKSIARYVERAEALGWEPGGPVEPDEALSGRVASGLRPGPPPKQGNTTEAKLWPHLERLRGWLHPPSGRAMTLAKAHILLTRYGIDVNYHALYRFACKHLDFGRTRLTVRMADCDPGEVAEVDFGYLGLVADPTTGRRRKLHALIVTLVHSRHQFVWTTHTQKISDFIEGIEHAWDFFGGVSRRVLLDNLRAAVTKADRYDPYFNRTFEQYACYRGFVIDACVVREPKQKPHVERQVPYVRENFFRGEDFLSRDDVQRRAEAWCSGRAGMRTHGTTRKQPLVEFEKSERAALIALEPAAHFDVPNWAEPKVHPDCHIRFANALYSVPFAYKGKQVTVRGDRALVRIYHRGDLIKTHERHTAGGRVTDYADYPREKAAYAMRDPNRIIAQARGCGTSVGRFAELLLAGDFPWAKLRQAQALLRMTEKYGDARVDGACRRALAFDLINVHRLKRIIENALGGDEQEHTVVAEVVQLPLRFERSPSSFRNTNNPNNPQEKTDGN